MSFFSLFWVLCFGACSMLVSTEVGTWISRQCPPLMLLVPVGEQDHSLLVDILGYPYLKDLEQSKKLLEIHGIKSVSNLKDFLYWKLLQHPLPTHTPKLGILPSASSRGNQQILVCIAQVMRSSLHSKLLTQCLRIADVIGLLHRWSQGWFPLGSPTGG